MILEAKEASVTLTINVLKGLLDGIQGQLTKIGKDVSHYLEFHQQELKDIMQAQEGKINDLLTIDEN